MSRKTLREWLTSAYDQADCPRPESWLEAELEVLSVEERQQLDSHVEFCPRCAVERRLAESFDQSEMQLTQAEIRDLTGKLDEAAPSPVVEFPQKTSSVRSTWLMQLAVAATVVLAVGLGFQLWRRQAPTLPDAPQIEVTRSTVVDLLQPIGEVFSVPEEMVWNSFEGAERYRLVVSGVDNVILWELTTGGTKAAIPAEIRAKLLPGVTYIWRVEATDSSDALIGRSESRQFRIRPDGGA